MSQIRASFVAKDELHGSRRRSGQQAQQIIDSGYYVNRQISKLDAQLPLIWNGCTKLEEGSAERRSHK